MGFGDLPERRELAEAGVGKEDIDAAFLLLNRRVQPVKICQIRYVTLNTGDVFFDLFHRGIEFALTTTGDKDMRALGNETFRGGETEAAIASGYNRNLTC